MKRFFYCIFSLVLLLAGCSYDDSGLWDKVDDLDSRLKEVEALVNRLNSELGAVKTIVGNTASSKAIVDVTETSTGCVITFSDGTSVTVKHGADGTPAPIIGVKKDSDGIYYWTVTAAGSTGWLLDNDGGKIPVAGEKGDDGQQGNDGGDGITPLLGVDTYGFWTVDYGAGHERILDADGNAVKAAADAGESLFERIDTSDESFVVFHFSNGELLVVARTDARFGFWTGNTVSVPEGGTVTLEMDIKNIGYAEVLKAPQGWGASIDLAGACATVTAGGGDAARSGMVSFLAMDTRGNVMMAGVMVEIEKDWGYGHPDGTWLVLEGNMTSENGTLVWFSPDMTMHENIFENANGGLQIGNVVQDIYIANDRLYILNQNGSNMGGAGRFVVCDIHTMEMEYALPLAFHTGGTLCWPQHMVVVSDKKAYIAWSDSNMEATSGIRVLDLETRQMAPGDIQGTYGEFTTQGATKGRMVHSRGKVFAGTGHSVVIIDTQTDLVEKKLEFGCQVKGVVKGVDGNIYIALAREYTGTGPNSPGSFVTNSRIVGIDHSGNTVHDKYLPDGVKFPVATWSPKIQMCASFTEPYIYFTDKDEFYFTSLARYNYQTGETTAEFVLTPDIYGYVGVHPATEELWTASSSTSEWQGTAVRIFDTSTARQAASCVANKGFCAGIDFGYRFTDEYVNR